MDIPTLTTADIEVSGPCIVARIDGVVYLIPMHSYEDCLESAAGLLARRLTGKVAIGNLPTFRMRCDVLSHDPTNGPILHD